MFISKIPFISANVAITPILHNIEADSLQAVFSRFLKYENAAKPWPIGGQRYVSAAILQGFHKLKRKL